MACIGSRECGWRAKMLSRGRNCATPGLAATIEFEEGTRRQAVFGQTCIPARTVFSKIGIDLAPPHPDTERIANRAEEQQMDERKRDSMVAYLRRRMSQVGIKVADLAAALAEDRRREKSARYRNAFGDTWDGKGAMPQWLLQATSAGQSLEHFAVEKSSKPAGRARPTVDWSRDPFAGSRLATVRPS